MKEALLVTGGRICIEFCLKYINEHRFDFMAAADSGLQFFYEAKQIPDLVVGDFDSVDGRILSFFKRQNKIQWIQLNPMKDDTDTEDALRELIKKGYEKIHILGATGSRIDHMLGNIGLLGIGLEKGIEILLIDPNNRIRMITETFSILKEKQYGRYISLLPVTPKVTGVTLTGMKYPLNNYTMECFYTIGISNEILEEEAEIRLKEGILLLIETKD